MSNWMKHSLIGLVNDLPGEDCHTMFSLAEVEGFCWRIQVIYRDLLAKNAASELQDHEEDVKELVAQAYDILTRTVERLEAEQTDRHKTAELLRTGLTGRPSFDIPRDVLEYLLDIHLSVPKIASIVGVSVSTIRRRMSEYELSVRDTYNRMSDQELDDVLSTANREFPTWGARQMYGYLISQDIRVQHRRVQESLSRIDPEGSFLRRLRCLKRRKYSVPGPQSLWHVDGNHKLIRYLTFFLVSIIILYAGGDW